MRNLNLGDGFMIKLKKIFVVISILACISILSSFVINNIDYANTYNDSIINKKSEDYVNSYNNSSDNDLDNSVDTLNQNGNQGDDNNNSGKNRKGSCDHNCAACINKCH